MIKTKVCLNCKNDYEESINFCLNCGSVLKSKDKIINCTFEYKCSLDWNNLEKSESNDIRFCSNCEKNVYFAHSQSELNQFASEGKCVAFNPEPINTFPDVPPLMGVIAKPEKMPEFRPTMGMPVYTKKEEKKKPWWKFWK